MTGNVLQFGLIGMLVVSSGCLGSRDTDFWNRAPRIDEFRETEVAAKSHVTHRQALASVPEPQIDQPALAFAATSTQPVPNQPEFRQVSMTGEDLEPGIENLNVPGAGSAELIPARPDTLRISGYDVSRHMNLNQVISLALVADPVLLAGFESINQADAEAITASLKPNPVLSVDQTLLPLTRPFVADVREGGPPQLDVILEYPIDWYLFGKRTAEIQSAQWGMQVSQSEFADLVRERVLEATVAFYDILEARELRDLARQDVENLRQVESITGQAVADGGRPQVELSRIRLDRLAAEQELRNAENELVTAKAELWALLGQTGTVASFDVIGSLDEGPTVRPMPLGEAFDIALSQRPDIQAARRRLQQARSDTWVEYKAAFPEVATRAGYTRQFQQRAIGFPDADSWGVGIDMSIPLYDRNQGNRLRASSVVSQTAQELRSTEANLRAELEQVTSELQTSAENAAAVAEEQLRLAEEVRDSLNTAYQLGGRPLIDALDAQRNYRETFRIFIESRSNYRRAAARYNATLGQQLIPNDRPLP